MRRVKERVPRHEARLNGPTRPFERKLRKTQEEADNFEIALESDSVDGSTAPYKAAPISAKSVAVTFPVTADSPASCRRMTAKPRRQMFPLSLRRRVVRRVSLLGRRLRSLWRIVLACTMLRKPTRYRQLPSTSSSSTSPAVCDAGSDQHCRDSSDLVALKISLLGDCQIGKTSFLTKYVGKEREEVEEPERRGLDQMVKTLSVGGARIAYSIWEVSGDETSHNHIPVACKDSVAILIMFDLTSRCTLNRWYQEARKWNQTAIPVLVGTKFDDFVQLPVDLQWTIANQARAYAKAMEATLFFSSTTYNINVTKIFKFITAKLFNLPWRLERNLTIGEPTIDF